MKVRVRDLSEINHIQYVYKGKNFYTTDLRYSFDSKDYFSSIRNLLQLNNYCCFHKRPWTYCNILGKKLNVQGWKIHISATYKNHKDILEKVVKLAVEHQMCFKFATNEENFMYINSKNIARASAGKFIVLYPDEKEFEMVLEELYIILNKYQGPYILSDRPYKDSEVIYYRYGEILPIKINDEYGTVTTKMIDKERKLIVDSRKPFFVLPHGICDCVHIYNQSTDTKKESVLLKKYKIIKALHFSSQGGVYLAEDCNEKKYIIKEARKYTGIDGNGIYATERIKKEYRILKLLEGKASPEVYEIFNEMGNIYIVEEYIYGEDLTKFPYKNSAMISNTKEQNFTLKVERIFSNCLKKMKLIHDKGIIINDISQGNIIYNEEKDEIKFIDFEVAQTEIDINAGALTTPGFSTGEMSSKYQDLLKCAMVIIYCAFPLNALFENFNYKIQDCIMYIYMNHGINDKTACLLLKIINKEIISVDEAIGYIEKEHNDIELIHNFEDISSSQLKQELKNEIDRTLSGDNITLYADPMWINTNCFSFGYGLFGIVYALKKMNSYINTKCLFDKILDFFVVDMYEQKSITSISAYVGIGGILAVISEFHYFKEAQYLFSIIDRL